MGARDLLAELADAGLTVTADGDRLVIRPASMLTDELRAALREAKPALLQLLGRGAPQPMAGAVDDDAARFNARRIRLIRWGYAEGDAQALAERLARRDRAGDERRACVECSNHRPGRCGNHRAAMLRTPETGRDLAELLQRCPGFRA